MATALKLEEPTGTDIVVAVANDPGIVLLDTEKFDVWYEKLKAEAPTDADVTTKKGQDALRSFAAKVRSEKAGINKARLRLTSGWRDMTAQANAAGKLIDERLEALAVEARRPLTEWEAAEKARADECRLIIENLRAAATVTIEDTAVTVRDRGGRVWSQAIDPERFGDMAAEAEVVKAATVDTLKTALARLTREEEERAELARLRAAEEARLARELAEREKRERQEREAEEARQAEEQRIAAEQAEKERIERAQQEAAARAQREAAEAAEAERLRTQRQHDEALAAERRRAEEAEAAAQAERDRAAAEERARVAEQARLADEERQREADKAALRARKTETKLALMGCGASEEVAQKIVTAIRAGDVPNIEWKR